jgi:hypothetical protein
VEEEEEEEVETMRITVQYSADYMLRIYTRLQNVTTVTTSSVNICKIIGFHHSEVDIFTLINPEE